MRRHQNLPPRRCANKRASRGTQRRNRRGKPAIEADAGARHRSRCGGLRQPGGHGGGTAPDPIPNSDVKPTSAYDTAPQGAGKSVAARSSEPPTHIIHRHTNHRHTMRHRSPTTAAPSNTHTTVQHTHPAAGWSSPVARQAHNLKVTGSNPVPAIRIQQSLKRHASRIRRVGRISVFLSLKENFAPLSCNVWRTG